MQKQGTAHNGSLHTVSVHAHILGVEMALYLVHPKPYADGMAQETHRVAAMEYRRVPCGTSLPRLLILVPCPAQRSAFSPLRTEAAPECARQDSADSA